MLHDERVACAVTGQALETLSGGAGRKKGAAAISESILQLQNAQVLLQAWSLLLQADS